MKFTFTEHRLKNGTRAAFIDTSISPLSYLEYLLIVVVCGSQTGVMLLRGFALCSQLYFHAEVSDMRNLVF